MAVIPLSHDISAPLRTVKSALKCFVLCRKAVKVSQLGKTFRREFKWRQQKSGWRQRDKTEALATDTGGSVGVNKEDGVPTADQSR